MSFYNAQLRQLQEQLARKRQLEVMARELRDQRDTLNERARRLRGAMLSEQADVDRLEGRSLAVFFYNVIGKMDERLTKEREEAYAARVKYDAAARELEGVEKDLRRCMAQLGKLHSIEDRYEDVLREKQDAVQAAGGPAAEEIFTLEARNAYLDSQKRELQEAVSAGNAALDTAKQVLASLDSAESWGTWDLLGGGLISDLAKHSRLDEAQGAIERLQSQLRGFKTELADVTIQTNMQVNVDGFLRFADYFFDGLFADWTVLNRISKSKSEVHSTKVQIEGILSRLDAMLRAAQQEQERNQNRIDTLVREAQL